MELLHHRVELIQRRARVLARAPREGPGKVPPQIAPLYGSAQGQLAARAAVGLSGYLEFRAWTTACPLDAEAKKKFPAPPPCDVSTWNALLDLVARTVLSRLIIEDLRRYTGMETVEAYRLHAADAQDCGLRSVREVIESGMLFADLLPQRCFSFNGSPLGVHLLTRIRPIGTRLAVRLRELSSAEMIPVGLECVEELLGILRPYVPSETCKKAMPLPEGFVISSRVCGNRASEGEWEGQDALPLESPSKLTSAVGLAEAAAVTSVMEAPDKASLDLAFGAIARAAGAEGTALRVDLLNLHAAEHVFSPGMVSGAPKRAIQMTHVHGQDSESGGGELFEEILRPAPEAEARYARIRAEADPLIRLLRRMALQNEKPHVVRERFRSSGSLDAGTRLPLAAKGLSDRVYRKGVARPSKEAGHGRPLLVLAADHSGSTGPQDGPRGRLITLLATSLAEGLLGSRVTPLIAVYDSGPLAGRHLPRVQWLFHPRKTPGESPRHAVSAIRALGDGCGCNADVLSLSHCVDEARQVQRERDVHSTIHLAIVSDGDFNRSGGGPSGKVEMERFFDAVRTIPDGPVVTALFAISKSDADRPAGVDAYLAIPETDLSRPETVASRLGRFVVQWIIDQKKRSFSRHNKGSRGRAGCTDMDRYDRGREIWTAIPLRQALRPLLTRLRAYDEALAQLFDGDGGPKTIRRIASLLSEPMECNGDKFSLDKPVECHRMLGFLGGWSHGLSLEIRRQRGFPVYLLVRTMHAPECFHRVVLEELFRSRGYPRDIDERFALLSSHNRNVFALDLSPLRPIAREILGEAGHASEVDVDDLLVDAQRCAIDAARDEDQRFAFALAVVLRLARFPNMVELVSFLLASDLCAVRAALGRSNGMQVRALLDRGMRNSPLTRLLGLLLPEWTGDDLASVVKRARRGYMSLNQAFSKFHRTDGAIEGCGGQRLGAIAMANTRRLRTITSAPFTPTLRAACAALEEVSENLEHGLLGERQTGAA